MNTSQIRSLKITILLWWAMVMGLACFSMCCFFFFYQASENIKIDITFVYVLAVVLAMVGMTSSPVVYKIQVRSASQVANPSKERLLSYYRSGFLLKMTLLEGPALFSIVAAWWTHQVLFAAITGGLLLLMIIAKPTERQFRKDFLHGRNL